VCQFIGATEASRRDQRVRESAIKTDVVGFYDAQLRAQASGGAGNDG
jgi:hypothetical protein